MKTVKVLVSELSKKALDWTVAKCEGLPLVLDPMGFKKDAPTSSQAGWWVWDDSKGFCKSDHRLIGHDYSPSTNWGQGGLIMTSIAGLQFKSWLESSSGTKCEAHIHNYEGDWVAFGSTILEAVMRCHVTSKLGDEVEIPSGLATKLSLDELKALWVNFGDIPTVYEGEHVDKIDEDFLHFSKGTHRETVWHWFETMNPAFSVGEIMSETCN